MKLNLSPFDEQMNLVLCNVRDISVDDARKVADNCLAAKERGENSSVWHQTSLFFGTSCNCAKCHPNKGAFKYHHVA